MDLTARQVEGSPASTTFGKFSAYVRGIRPLRPPPRTPAGLASCPQRPTASISTEAFTLCYHCMHIFALALLAYAIPGTPEESMREGGRRVAR